MLFRKSAFNNLNCLIKLKKDIKVEIRTTRHLLYRTTRHLLSPAEEVLTYVTDLVRTFSRPCRLMEEDRASVRSGHPRLAWSGTGRSHPPVTAPPCACTAPTTPSIPVYFPHPKCSSVPWLSSATSLSSHGMPCTCSSG